MERAAVLITGAGRGIGAAIADAAARDGWDVVLHYHESDEGAQAAAHRAEAQGVAAHVLQADLGDWGEAQALVEDAFAAMPNLRALVNNAGIYQRTRLPGLTRELYERTMAVNVDACMATCRAVADRFTDAGGGSIVNLSSIIAAKGSGHATHYATSKAGLLGLTRALAIELAPANVRVNAICPGMIETDMIGDDTPEDRARRERSIPMGRVGQPDEIADVAAWLLSERASYVTGQTIHVNGGLHLG